MKQKIQMKQDRLFRERPPKVHSLKVTKAQYEALEVFISCSIKTSLFATKVILWFLRQSNFLSHDIAVSIRDKDLSLKVVDAIHEMNSSHDGKFTLCRVFKLIGVQKNLSFHFGILEKVNSKLTRLKTEKMDVGYTLWLSKRCYQRKVRLIKFNLLEVVNIIVDKECKIKKA